MGFLYPWMLWALVALAIPIAVHLFNFRRHKLVYFSNTALLKTIQQENSKTNKLKYLVVLALRCIFIVALVLAFAFPFLKDKAMRFDSDEDLVGVYIDNSMSMKAQSTRTTLLEEARESARALVDQLPPSTRYLLMTNSFEVENEYPMNREEMLGRLDRMNPDGPPVMLNEVIDRFTMLSHTHGFAKATLFTYSDFQQRMLDLTGVRQDTALRMVVVPMSTEVRANLSIDTVWLASPVMLAGMGNEIRMRVTNHGGKEIKGLPVNLSVNGKVVASATVDVEEDGSAELGMQFLLEEPGAARCSVSLMDYPINFDDAYHFVIEPRPVLHVVELNPDEGPTDLSLVFAEDPQYAYTLMHPSRMDLPTLSRAQLIVVSQTSAINETLRQSLLDDAAEGAIVAFFHDDGRSVDTSAMGVSDLAIRHEFFNDIILDLPQHADLPRVRQHVALTPSADATVLASLDNGDPFLMERASGKGRVYDFATTLDASWSTLADNALFVPLMVKMALLGGGVDRLSYTLGIDKTLVFGDQDVEGDRAVMLCDESRSYVMMPAHEVRNNRLCVFLQEVLPAAGFYELLVNDSVAHVMAWNDSRMESEMHFCDRKAINSAFETAGIDVAAILEPAEFMQHDLVQAMARQSSLWRWFALIALIALAAEVAVLRFWK